MVDMINLTPHPVTIGDITIAPSGTVLRLTEKKVVIDTVNNIPVYAVSYSVPDLPPIINGIIYIVSGMIADNVNRSDFYVPYNMVRDNNGHIVGCTGLRK